MIHTVAPIWSGKPGVGEEERVFSACYSSALALADENGIESIAFPAIGTGAYRWPADRASELAFAAVVRHLREGGKQTRVVFCCFARADRERYAALIQSLT